MGRRPCCCDRLAVKRGAWTPEEDRKLVDFVASNERFSWRALPRLAGLLRCGKSCRLRWTNYLRPDLKRGMLDEAEDRVLIEMHARLGNRWSKIASGLPGRTDNEIKNHWNSYVKKKLLKMGFDPTTHEPLNQGSSDTQIAAAVVSTTGSEDSHDSGSKSQEDQSKPQQDSVESRSSTESYPRDYDRDRALMDELWRFLSCDGGDDDDDFTTLLDSPNWEEISSCDWLQVYRECGE